MIAMRVARSEEMQGERSAAPKAPIVEATAESAGDGPVVSRFGVVSMQMVQGWPKWGGRL